MGKVTKIILIVIIVIALVSAVIGALFRQPRTDVTTATATPTPPLKSGFASTSDTQRLKSENNFAGEQNLNDEDQDTKVYNYTTDDPYIYDKVVVKNNKTVYKTTDLWVNGEYPKLTSYFERYGDYEIRALDRLMGIDIFVYPQTGVAVVGSEQANEARKLYEFEPQTKDEFMTNLSNEMLQKSHQ